MLVEYNDSGEIGTVLTVYDADMVDLWRKAEKRFIAVAPLIIDAGRYYVRDGDLIVRPLMPHAIDRTTIIADGEDMMVIAGLPEPCTLHFTDHLGDVDIVECDDGAAEISAVDPGHHRLRIEAWPYLPLDITYTATPAGTAPPDDGMDAIWSGEDANAD